MKNNDIFNILQAVTLIYFLAFGLVPNVVAFVVYSFDGFVSKLINTQ